ncbi:MAG: shikimate dehydrogenase [Synechococcales cyanobacterium]
MTGTTPSGLAITGGTRLLGLLGDPVHHSLSPAMHNAALAVLGLDYVYVPLPVRDPDLAVVLQGLRAVGVQGLNVTIPHKQAVMPLIQTIQPVAGHMGAVNTLYPLADGGWGGTNTDAIGFQAPLQQQDWSGKTVTVLGYGGSARAVLYACQQLGFAQIQVITRDPQAVRTPLPGCSFHSWSDLPPLLPHTDLLVNTTPIGMKSSATPVERDLLATLPPAAWVYDLIYVPAPTTLLHMAQELGYHTQNGLEMLVQQGAAALSLWLGGIPVPIEIMRSAALAHVSRDG